MRDMCDNNKPLWPRLDVQPVGGVQHLVHRGYQLPHVAEHEEPDNGDGDAGEAALLRVLGWRQGAVAVVVWCVGRGCGGALGGAGTAAGWALGAAWAARLGEDAGRGLKKEERYTNLSPVMFNYFVA